MSELRKDPSPQELLDRIVRLETALSRLQLPNLSALKAEIEALRREQADLSKAFQIEGDSVTAMFREIDDHLWPVVYKVFPGVARDHKEIFRLADRGKPGKNKKGPLA